VQGAHCTSGRSEPEALTQAQVREPDRFMLRLLFTSDLSRD